MATRSVRKPGVIISAPASRTRKPSTSSAPGTRPALMACCIRRRTLRPACLASQAPTIDTRTSRARVLRTPMAWPTWRRTKISANGTPMKITNRSSPTTPVMVPAGPERRVGFPAPGGPGGPCPGPPRGRVGGGDDPAVLDGGLLFATDVLTEGVHFDLRWATTADVGWKALAVNLSDLAAMGGSPRAAVCGVVLGAGRKGEADDLAAGIMAAAAELGCPLVGGDTVVGAALTVTVAVIGDSPEGGAVLRSGAQPGDSVFVTGPLGGSKAALGALRPGGAVDPVALARL